MSDLEKNFYREVDQNRRSTRGPWLVLFSFLIIIFILAILALVKIRSTFSGLNFDLWNFDYQLPKIALSEKILTAAKETDQENLSIPINSTELSAYFNLTDEDFPLKNTYAKIKPTTIVIYGQLRTSRFGLPVSLTLVPGVSNGALIFSPSPTEVEAIIIPEEARRRTADEINKRVKFDFDLCQGFKVSSVEQTDDQLTIKMEKTKDESASNN